MIKNSAWTETCLLLIATFINSEKQGLFLYQCILIINFYISSILYCSFCFSFLDMGSTNSLPIWLQIQHLRRHGPVLQLHLAGHTSSSCHATCPVHAAGRVGKCLLHGFWKPPSTRLFSSL